MARPTRIASLRELAELIDPDGNLSGYRMVLTVTVASVQEGDALAGRLQREGYSDAGWRAQDPLARGLLRTRTLVGVEATVMVVLGEPA